MLFQVTNTSTACEHILCLVGRDTLCMILNKTQFIEGDSNSRKG